jgi:HD-GYP domain-containing protein (c-di-GMP phosphodiesterase class II)
MSVRGFVIALWVAAAAAFCAVWLVAPGVESAAVKATLWFAGLGLVGHVLTFSKLPGAPTGTVAYLPFVSAIVLAPTWFTVAAIAVVTATAELIARRPVIKSAFNVGQAVLTTAISILVFRAIQVPDGGGGMPSLQAAIPSYLLTAVVFLNINAFALAGVISLADRRPFLSTWRGVALEGLGGDLVAVPFVFVFGQVYFAFGGYGVALLAVPLIGLRQLSYANWQLKRINQELLELMVAAIEARDPYTSGHSRRVSRAAATIAQAMGLAPGEVERITQAALLHDVGKIYEEFASILRKPGALTSDEMALMETHPIRSAELVSKVSNLRGVVADVRHHHERWDGAGYPDKLRAHEIPLGARIIMVADTIDAMTTDRPYREALDASAVRSELLKWKGLQFDPDIVERLVNSSLFDTLFHQTTGGPTVARTPRHLKTPRARKVLAS